MSEALDNNCTTLALSGSARPRIFTVNTLSRSILLAMRSGNTAIT